MRFRCSFRIKKRGIGEAIYSVTYAIICVNCSSCIVHLGTGYSQKNLQKIYACTFVRNTNLSVDQIVGQIRVFCWMVGAGRTKNLYREGRPGSKIGKIAVYELKYHSGCGICKTATDIHSSTALSTRWVQWTWTWKIYACSIAETCWDYDEDNKNEIWIWL